MPGCAFGGREGDDRQRTEFARQRFVSLAHLDRSERGRACDNLKFRIGEVARLAARPVDFDLEIGCLTAWLA
jgi:hypothetical protein